MAALTTQSIVYAGTAPTFGAASTSDTAEVGQRKFAVYKNTNAATRTLTINRPDGVTPYTEVNPDVQYTIPVNPGEVWVPLHPDYDEGTGRTTLTLSSATDVTVAIVDANWVI